MEQHHPIPTPAWLTRSAIYKRLPFAVRARLDRTILLRPAKCATLEAIAQRFQLTDKYGISLPAFRAYARKLEQLARPTATSQLLAALLGCLPQRYRQQLVDGSQVILLSRLLNALDASTDTALSVADLARLAAALTSLARRSSSPTASTTVNRRPSPDGKGKSPDQADPSGLSSRQPDKMAEAVRTIYDLSWPPKTAKPKPEPG